jgi:ASC-1-like (ASCH) protein
MKTWNLPFRAEDRDKFEALKSGHKSTETRAGGPKYRGMIEGDLAVITCGQEKLERRIVNLRHFETLEELFQAVPYAQIFPWATSLEEAKGFYDAYPGYTERIRDHGVVAFELE